MSKSKKGGLDQYGRQCFGRLILATIRKIVGLKELMVLLFLFILLYIIYLKHYNNYYCLLKCTS